MNRREFLAAAGAAGSGALAQSAPSIRPRFWSINAYHFRQGTQGPRLNDYFSKALIPAVGRHHGGPVLALEALVAPHLPQVALIFGFNSWDEIWNVTTKMNGDEALKKAHTALESGAEPPFERQHDFILEAAAYQPELKPETRDRSRIFELRVYHSPTWRQLAALHERFAGPEIKIFHRVGIHPILYGTTIVGPDMPNLTYLIPFDNLAAREKAWDAFAADEEWRKVRADSIARHGQITSVIQISIFRAAAYSPIR